MHIKVELNERLINACLALHYNYKPTGKRQKQRLLLIPIMLCCLAFYLMYDELKRPVVGQNFYMALLYIGFAAGYYFFMRSRMLGAGRQLLKQLGPNASFNMDISGDRIITSAGDTIIENGWSEFTGALVSKDFVLLYQANNSFVMLSKSFFASGDFEVFTQWVREKVQPVVEASGVDKNIKI